MDVLLIIAVAMPIAFMLIKAIRGRHRGAHRRVIDDVHRQHVYLFNGGFLSESAVQSARVHLEQSLASGNLFAIDAAFRAGTGFAATARAAAEIDTELAREVLERQLTRTIVDHPLEQAWYQLDIARSLRRMNRLPSMAALVRAAEADGPLAHFLAAEAVSFPGFAGLLERPEHFLGRAALVALRRALDGIRHGVEPRIVGIARLGEAAEILWDQRFHAVNPMVIRTLSAVRRFIRRIDHADRWFASDESGRMMFRLQADRLIALEEVLTDYLDESQAVLLDQLAGSAGADQQHLLATLIDLRADTAPVVVPMVKSRACAAPKLAFESLMSTTDMSVGPWLCDWLRHESDATGNVRIAALQLLRRFPSVSAEQLLLATLDGSDAKARSAALRSLGWWVPIQHAAVIGRLQVAARDHSLSVAQSAQAALARLGDRKALRWFRHQLVNDERERVHGTLERIAAEGLILLWPDLDALADADDVNLALHAREALEQMREDLSFSSTPR